MEHISVPIDYVKELGSYNDAVVLNYIRKRMYHKSGLLVNGSAVITLDEISEATFLSVNEIKGIVRMLSDEGYINIKVEQRSNKNKYHYVFNFGSI